MTDAATIEARVRAENPFFAVSEGAVSWTVSPDEFPEWYEELIAERVAWAIEAEKLAATEATQRTRRQQFIAGMTTLRENLKVLRSTSTTQLNWSAMTSAQRQEALRQGLIDATQADIWLGEILQDLRQIERNGK